MEYPLFIFLSIFCFQLATNAETTNPNVNKKLQELEELKYTENMCYRIKTRKTSCDRFKDSLNNYMHICLKLKKSILRKRSFCVNGEDDCKLSFLNEKHGCASVGPNNFFTLSENAIIPNEPNVSTTKNNTFDYAVYSTIFSQIAEFHGIKNNLLNLVKVVVNGNPTIACSAEIYCQDSSDSYSKIDIKYFCSQVKSMAEELNSYRGYSCYGFLLLTIIWFVATDKVKVKRANCLIITCSFWFMVKSLFHRFVTYDLYNGETFYKSGYFYTFLLVSFGAECIFGHMIQFICSGVTCFKTKMGLMDYIGRYSAVALYALPITLFMMLMSASQILQGAESTICFTLACICAIFPFAFAVICGLQSQQSLSILRQVTDKTEEPYKKLAECYGRIVCMLFAYLLTTIIIYSMMSVWTNISYDLLHKLLLLICIGYFLYRGGYVTEKFEMCKGKSSTVNVTKVKSILEKDIKSNLLPKPIYGCDKA